MMQVLNHNLKLRVSLRILRLVSPLGLMPSSQQLTAWMMEHSLTTNQQWRLRKQQQT